MEDSQIIELYNARSSAAVKETDKKYGRLCYSVADGILHSREDDEECVNDTYLAVWNKIPPEKPDIFSAFLCKITRNLALKKYEYKRAKKRREPDAAIDELAEILPDNEDLHGKIEAKELGEAINAFLRSLPPDERNMFIRRYWLFDPVKRIAADFRFSVSKVKSILFRTRKKLKEYIINYYKEDM